MDEGFGSDREGDPVRQRKELLGYSRKVLWRELFAPPLVDPVITEITHDATQVALVGDVHLDVEGTDAEISPGRPGRHHSTGLRPSWKAVPETGDMVGDLLLRRLAKEEQRVGVTDFGRQRCDEQSMLVAVLEDCPDALH